MRAAAALLVAALALHGQHGLRFTTPATVWDEALPLGNGMLGALAWGDGQPLKISLDRADLWDLRPVPEFSSDEYRFDLMKRWHEEGRVKDLIRVYEAPYHRPAPTKIPAGRIEITLDGARFVETSLRIEDATGRMSFAGGGSIEIFVHATEPVGMLRLRGLAPSIRLVAPPFAGKVENAAQGGISPGDLSQLGYPAPKQSNIPGRQCYEQQGWGGFRFAVCVAWSNNGTAAWTVASSFEGRDPLRIAEQRVARALKRGYDAMFASHRAWWSAYWAKSSIRVPNSTIERQWYLEQYKFGSASRRGAPPITLQAVWTADNGQLPPWKGDYHHDLNTQLSYWPCYSGHHLEEGLAYLDWLWKTRDAGFAWTKRFFGLPGLNVPMTADLNGNQIGGWRQYTHSATTAAWLAHHFYLHWRYSGDRAFLRDRAYPYLRYAAIFLEAFTAQRGPDGKRTHPLSASPEINDNRPSAWFATVTNYDLTLERWLFGAAAELASELGKSDEAARWRKVLGELPEFALGDDLRLLVAAGYPLKESHRHFSHLMAIHPLGLIDRANGERDARIIRASLDDLERLGTSMWCGYSFSWLANLAARAGDGAKAERALEIFSTAFTLRNSFHANGDQSGKGYSKFTYRPFTLEGNFAMAAGLQEMLIQSHSGRVQLFPAVPGSWSDASFTGLRAEGGLIVSARLSGGRLAEATLRAERGGGFRFAAPGLSETTVRLKAGETRSLP